VFVCVYGVCMCMCLCACVCVCVCVCTSARVFLCVTYLHQNKNFVAKFWRNFFFTTFNFCFLKLRPVAFHRLHYKLFTIIWDKVPISKILQYYNHNLLTDTFIATVWSFMSKDCVCFVQKQKGTWEQDVNSECELLSYLLLYRTL
jgi:hypothetical protein